jgi:hypothetical protein
MKRRLFHAKPDGKLKVEVLQPASPYMHYHCQGNCRNPAKFTVLRDGVKFENLCRHHASEVCEQNGIHMPDLP